MFKLDITAKADPARAELVPRVVHVSPICTPRAQQLSPPTLLIPCVSMLDLQTLPDSVVDISPGQTIAGHPHSHLQGDTPQSLTAIPVHLCTFPSPVWWSWSKGKLPEVLSAVWMLVITPHHPRWCFHCHLPKTFKRKGKLCSFFLSFLSPCPRVLLLLCSELPHCVHAAHRKLSGRGAAAPSGNCSYQTALCQKGIIAIIIIIKP